VKLKLSRNQFQEKTGRMQVMLYVIWI